MRIIAGEFRGRRLVAPPGRGTRPMLDRVREALFSTLGERVAGAGVLDLFSGTGSLGLEALSRGARRADFFERDRRALAALRENLARLGVEQRARLHAGDALQSSRWPEAVDLAFLDPPYPLWRDPRGRRQLFDALECLFAEHLVPGGVAVLHSHPRDLSPTDLAAYRPVERTYGRTTLWYLSEAKEQA